MSAVNILILIITLVMLAGAAAVVTMKSMIGAAIMEGIVSLMAALLFLKMGAPDVAITQAVIGAGLSTALFVMALNRAGIDEKEASDE
ncbi:DUF4040 domain-containing protein [Myxococcota bacterium]|nr:DUF4040 domain-containing protein [Myxococcota bacterium]MBU1383059.1 DUF4040 domain-containing protein [Myxococcota bacterium]MBU1497604.1 DUF4040 domain-containing protein [Myxococcota bacterium]